MAENISPITTHVLDVMSGEPAAGLPVRLERLTTGKWEAVASGLTDSDGRLKNWFKGQCRTGVFRLSFETGAYFEKNKIHTFYPAVEIVFEIKEERHHHVPLLLSPFGYSTYRGS